MAYPYPATPLPSGTLAPVTGGAAAPFQDCARTPGMVGCDPAAVPLKARLAYFDSNPPRLVSLDLETGQGWQAAWKGEAPTWLEWSEGDAREARLLVSLGGGRYQVFSSDGSLLETFTSETIPAWQPDGALSRDGSVHSPAGDTVRLEHTPDLSWLLHVKTTRGEEHLPLDANPGDILYKLLGWVPGSQALLAQAYYAGNEAMTQGGRVVTIDVNTGAIKTTQASMSLSDFLSPFFTWDPVHDGRLAFLETGETSVYAPRLALLDFQTGEVRYPLPGDPLICSLAWRPDGTLAFAVGGREANPRAGQKDAPGPGVYLLDPQAGSISSLVEPLPGGALAWLHWTADGQVLVYARVLPGQKSTLSVQVRARRLSDGMEWVLVERLEGLETLDCPGLLNGVIAYSLRN